MSSPRKSDKPRRSRGTAARSAREIDQLELIATMLRSNARLQRALLTVFEGTSPRALAAFGELMGFVARGARR